MLDMYVISLERLLKNLRYFPNVVLILMNFMSGMSILFHTTKLKGNGLLNIIGVKIFCAMTLPCSFVFVYQYTARCLSCFFLQRIVPHHNVILKYPDLTTLFQSFVYHKIDSYD